MKILLLKNSRIDKKKYDHCIEKSSFGTIYALSWYLDIVAPGWKLFMAEDYTYVMPLPVKYKLGIIPYLIQPVLCQQLGLFSQKEINEKIMKSFLDKIHFPFVLLQLNLGNTFPFKNTTLRSNYFLDLNKPYEELHKGYRSNCRRNLRNIDTFGLVYEKNTPIDNYLNIVKTSSDHCSESVFSALKSLVQEASFRNVAVIRSVRKENEMMATALFLHFKNRFYYLFPVSSPIGKDYQAMRFLLDEFIKENSGTSVKLDFEGSSVASVAQFYESFGSTLELYPRYFKTYLPFISKTIF
jgi:hypothetical protein